MIGYLWPLLLILLANTFYNICTKSIPSEVNPLASLLVTYLTAGVFCLILYLFTARNADVINEFRKINWTAPVLRLSIVGLEGGFIFAYKAGWPISPLFMFQSAFFGNPTAYCRNVPIP